MLKFEREDKGTEQYQALHEGTGNIVYKDLFNGLHRLGCNIQIWQLEAGVVEGDHEHTEDRLEEIYYVIAGHAVFTTPEGDRLLKSGEAVFASVDEVHGVRNDGPEMLKLLVVYGEPRK